MRTGRIGRLDVVVKNPPKKNFQMPKFEANGVVRVRPNRLEAEHSTEPMCPGARAFARGNSGSQRLGLPPTFFPIFEGLRVGENLQSFPLRRAGMRTFRHFPILARALLNVR